MVCACVGALVPNSEREILSDILFYDFITKYSDTFFVEKMRKLLHCKSFSHFFNKNIGKFQTLTFEISTKGYRIIIACMLSQCCSHTS